MIFLFGGHVMFWLDLRWPFVHLRRGRRVAALDAGGDSPASTGEGHGPSGAYRPGRLKCDGAYRAGTDTHPDRTATLRETIEQAVRAWTSLTWADLTGADLTGADLTGADLAEANLTWADLTGANLARANLTGANLTWANLTGANLTGADLTGADLAEANLTWADLTGANLTWADLTGVNLTGADLAGANLTRADLTGANLTRADLTGADLTGADLTGADLAEAIGINALRMTPLMMLRDQPGPIRAYKIVTACGEGIYNGGLRYTVGQSYEVLGADTNEQENCGVGIHLATLDWCLREYVPGYRVLVAEFTAADIAAIPLGSDGKFRVFRCRIVAEKTRAELGLEPTPISENKGAK